MLLALILRTEKHRFAGLCVSCVHIIDNVTIYTAAGSPAVMALGGLYSA